MKTLISKKNNINDVANALQNFFLSYFENVEVNYIPEFDPSSLTSLRICIVPAGNTLAKDTRATIKNQYKFTIAIIKKIAIAEITNLLTQLEDVKTELFKRELDLKADEVAYIESLDSSCYDIEELKNNGIFIQTIDLTCKVYE